LTIFEKNKYLRQRRTMADARNGDVDAHPPWQEAMSEVIRVATSLTYGAGVLTSPAFTAALKTVLSYATASSGAGLAGVRVGVCTV
jgi:hypothetical protein